MRCISSRFWHAVTVSLLSLPLSAPAGEIKLQPFSTDGCSAFFERSPMDRKKDWCLCCFEHDLAYWRGGTEAERLKADEALKICVMQSTHNQHLADAMFNAVRVGGAAELLTTYRWGYGWPYGRYYAPLSAEESARADALQAEYLATNPVTLSCPVNKPSP